MTTTTRHIALLRGINVGGHRKIKMVDLRTMLEAMGFKNVATYIQSGNIVFDASKQNPAELGNAIKQQIEETFGHDVPIIICTVEELNKIQSNIPFDQKEGWKRYITFLAKQPSKTQQKKLEAQSSAIETFRVGKKVVYVHVDKQTDRKLLFSSNFIQKKLKIPTTNRNLRTVQKIIKLAAS